MRVAILAIFALDALRKAGIVLGLTGDRWRRVDNVASFGSEL
jgi:hypothetical protein